MEIENRKKKLKSPKEKSIAIDASTNGHMSEDEDELLSLAHYVEDEEKLVELLFDAIQGTRLEAMMPPVLKAIPVQDLKLLCVHELRGISKKRRIAIIQGRELSDSSGSSEDEYSSNPPEESSPTRHRRRNAAKLSSEGAEATDGEKPMDIVELEMRARLIQTMLKGGTADTSFEESLTVKDKPPSSRRSFSSSRSTSRSCSRSSSADSRAHKKRSRHSRRGRRDRHDDSSSESKTPEDDRRKQSSKKHKISRKEFEDRMKKAKENRSYRKRKNSEDDEEEEGALEVKQIKQERSMKREPDEEGARSEKEEGEIDSNEEEGAYHSDESERRHKRHKRSHSYSSDERSRKRSRRNKKFRKEKLPVDKNLILASLNDQFNTEHSLRSKPVMESVDSEEDFDSLGSAPTRTIKLDPNAHVILRTDRTNVSFSFNKKAPSNVLPTTDFEFGGRPFGQKPMGIAPDKSEDQIVISSDSEGESKKRNKVSSKHDDIDADDDSSHISADKEGALAVSDQNDLNLCEATVMNNVLDLDDEYHESTGDAHQTDFTVKQELLQEVCPSDSINLPCSQSTVESSLNTSLEMVPAEQVAVKREILSPERMVSEELSLGNVVKSEPWDDLSSAISAAKANKSKKKSHKPKTSHADNDSSRQFKKSDSALESVASNQNFQDYDSQNEQSKFRSSDLSPNTTMRKDLEMGEIPDDLSGSCPQSNSFIRLPNNETLPSNDLDECSSSGRQFGDHSNRESEVGDNSADNMQYYRGFESLSQDSIESSTRDRLSPTEHQVQEEKDSGLVDLQPDEAEQVAAYSDSLSHRRRRRSSNKGNLESGEAEHSSEISWSSRWLQSKKVQKVVSSNKMLNRMRKRIMKASGKTSSTPAVTGVIGEEVPPDDTVDETSNDSSRPAEQSSVPVITNVEEYQRLLQLQERLQKELKGAEEEEGEVVGDSSEESEDDELWSKMMGN